MRHVKHPNIELVNHVIMHDIGNNAIKNKYGEQ